MKDFSPEYLLEEASRKTGLTDFGGDDFREGFEVLVTSLGARNEVPTDRHDQLREYFLRLLMNRLWFEKDLSENPEIAEQELLPPVYILSLPRTGTTKLQRILGATNAFQDLLFWRAFMFARIPGAGDGGVDLRKAATQDYVDWRLSVVPDYNMGHPMFPESPEEDPYLSEFSFCTALLALNFNAPEYLEWLASADDSYMYDYMLLQLKYLQWQFNPEGDKPWLLKSVAQLGNESKLDRIFPNGYRILCPHRMPDKIFPSTAKVFELMQQEFTPDLDGDLRKGRPAALVTQVFGQGMSQHMEWRKTSHNAEILDLSFRDVTHHSIDAARKVCEFLKVPYTSELEQRISAWDRKNPRHRHGKHGATLEEYGMDGAQIRDMMSPYIDAFSKYL